MSETKLPKDTIPAHTCSSRGSTGRCDLCDRPITCFAGTEGKHFYQTRCVHCGDVKPTEQLNDPVEEKGELKKTSTPDYECIECNGGIGAEDVVPFCVDCYNKQPQTFQADDRIATDEEIERLANALATTNNDNLKDYEGPRGERNRDNPYRQQAYVALHALGYKIPGLIDCAHPGACNGCPGCQGVKL